MRFAIFCLQKTQAVLITCIVTNIKTLIDKSSAYITQILLVDLLRNIRLYQIEGKEYEELV